MGIAESLEKTLEKSIIEEIKSYTYNMSRLAEIKEQLEEIQPKITSTYGNLGCACSKSNKSNVERMGNRRLELTNKRNMYLKKLIKIETMIEKSGLDVTEKSLMWWIARTGNIQAYARRYHIGKDNVYKIRDRAAKKIVANLVS